MWKKKKRRPSTARIMHYLSPHMNGSLVYDRKKPSFASF